MDLYRMSLLQIFLAGGPMMWPILICSIIALAVMMERFWYLHKINKGTQDFLANILDRVKRHQIKEALELCDNTKHPLAYILRSGILKYDRPRSQIKEALQDASLYQIPKLERNMSVLATISHLAPLMGLLGTVTGMVRVFQAIQAKTTALLPFSPSDLAGGIWEAMLTTVAGLLVAIPAFVAYNYLVSQINNIILDMEKAATELVNFLAE